jgi:hypothetical protein
MEHVPRMIRAAPTGGLPPIPTLGERTAQAYNPYAGPVVPQQQQAYPLTPSMPNAGDGGTRAISSSRNHRCGKLDP